MVALNPSVSLLYLIAEARQSAAVGASLSLFPQAVSVSESAVTLISVYEVLP
jgi:hypothetical protein